MSVPRERLGLKPDMSMTDGGGHREKSTPESHPYESYVLKSLSRIQALAEKEPKSLTLLDDVRNLLSWWNETKILLSSYTFGSSIHYRISGALAQRSLRPLFEPHLTEDQYNRLTKSFNENYGAIKGLITRFQEGPGQQTANAELAQEVSAAKTAMSELRQRTYTVDYR